MNTPLDDNDRTVIRPAAPAGTALPVGTGLGEFVVVRVIGEGGFGIVYEAIDRTLQRHVAVKEFMPASLAARNADGQVSVRSARHRETFDTALRSFVNEARLLAHFDHPALVKVHRFWEANGTAYMVMPLYDGMTLQDTLRNAASAPSEGLLMALLGPLTEALLVLHEQQCFHRDIAPDNILLLAGSGAPLLLDFGAARRVIGDMTQALTVILKPGYAPIEQYAETAASKQGPWTDVYALAAVVYFAITRRTPPPAVSRLVDDQYEPAARVAAGRYSAALLNAVDRALAVHPAARTQSIEDFRAQLGFARRTAQHDSGWSQFADSTSAAAGDAPPLMPSLVATRAALLPPQVDRSRRGLWVAGVALLAALGAGSWFYANRTPTPVAVAPTPAPAPSPSPSPTPPHVTEAPAPARTVGAFERLLQNRSAGFEVSASPARRRLRINEDRLSFTVTSARSGFVHVMLREPDGTLLLMFPNARSARNKITAGKPLVLPQSTWPLVALDPPGVQRFLVVVTQHPHDFAVLKIAQRGDYLLLDGDLRSANASGGALPGRAACDGAACNAYGAAAFDVEVVP
jgi:serine/threonine protein kinase